MKRILITGGAGFIGSHTAVVLFKNGYLPIIVDNFSNSTRDVLRRIEEICNEKFPFYEGDCVDPTFLERVFDSENSISCVIHFAAYKSVNESIEKPMKYYRNNICSLLSLLDVMIKREVSPLVFSSSCTVYGSPDHNPVTEDMPMKETPSTYGKTKQICENIIRNVVEKKKKIKAISLRYFNPIGAHPSGLIGELPIGPPNNLVSCITQTACGIREKLTIFGDDYNTLDGTCIRDYIHVLDLAEAHIKAFEYLDTIKEQCYYETFNLGTGHGHSVMDVVKTFEQVTGQKLRYVIGNHRPGDVESCYANVDKAKQRMNWQTQFTFGQALKHAWNWQQNLQISKNSYLGHVRLSSGRRAAAKYKLKRKSVSGGVKVSTIR